MSEENKLIPTMSSVYSDLPFGEQLVLWGVRMWTKAFNQGSNSNDIIQKGFRLAGVPESYISLDTIMHIIATSGEGIIDIRCTGCSSISIDEHRIIGAFAAYQSSENHTNGDEYLSLWLPPASLRIARGSAFKLANSFYDGGLMLRPRPWTQAISIDIHDCLQEPTNRYSVH